MKIPQKKKRRGFTLIEFLLYAGVVSLLLFGVSMLSMNTFAQKGKTEAMTLVEQVGGYTLWRMIHEAQEAVSIEAPIPGATSSLVILRTNSTSTDPTVITLSEQKIVIKQGVLATSSITSEYISASNLLFVNSSASGTPGVLTFSFDMSSGDALSLRENYFSQTFETSVTLRLRK